jgi:hypothetical protein
VIYNETNITKRKAGSKELVKWLNRLGHGIPYDEVNYLETTLAQDAVRNQIFKSFCPSILQPSIFVTFVWDNNDNNTLNETSMHVTNGVFVQLKSLGQVNECSAYERVARNKDRTFQTNYK